jgi:hypothetical protein
MVTVDETRLSASVVLKNAAIEVMVPALGEENAKFSSSPVAPVRSIVARDL